MSNDRGGDSLKNQLRESASASSPVPERADVMARALFALKFADKWIAEQVEETSVSMRGGADQVRSSYSATGQDVEIVVERGIDRRITGATTPSVPGWVLIRAGNHRELIRLDEDGMFTATVPGADGPIDVVLEFDHGLTMTMQDVGS